MKNCFYRLAVFFVIGFIFFTILYFVSNHYSPPYRREKFRINQLLDKSETIEALAVGNSHNYALDFETLGLNGYHIWQGGNDVFETKYQIESLMPKLPHVKTVFYAISYFTFHWENAASSSKDRTGIRRKYYFAIPSFKFIPGDFTDFILAKSSPIIRNDHWQAVFISIIRGRDIDLLSSLNDYFQIDSFGKPLSSARFSHMSKDSLRINTIKIRVPFLLREQNDMVTDHPNLTQDTYTTVVSIVKYLQNKDIRLIMYTPPFFKLHTDLYDKETISIMKENMRKLQKSFGVDYYDFSTDTTFTSNHLIFRNADHLNEQGAKLFSRKFRLAFDEN